jgi:hypothetical protein
MRRASSASSVAARSTTGAVTRLDASGVGCRSRRTCSPAYDLWRQRWFTGRRMISTPERAHVDEQGRMAPLNP